MNGPLSSHRSHNCTLLHPLHHPLIHLPWDHPTIYQHSPTPSSIIVQPSRSALSRPHSKHRINRSQSLRSRLPLRISNYCTWLELGTPLQLWRIGLWWNGVKRHERGLWFRLFVPDMMLGVVGIRQRHWELLWKRIIFVRENLRWKACSLMGETLKGELRGSKTVPQIVDSERTHHQRKWVSV